FKSALKDLGPEIDNAKVRAVRGQDLCCLMSNPAEKPEVVQLPAETPTPAPVNTRRVAAQRVREARDRFTSTSGTRPAFDSELLRQYAQTRMSASYVVMLLVVATGALFGLWLPRVSAQAWTRGRLLVRLGASRH